MGLEGERVEPLLWDGALRRILTLLEEGPDAEETPWSLSSDEIEMLQMAGFGPLLSDSLARHAAFPVLFAEHVLNGRRIDGHRRALAALSDRLGEGVAPPIVFKGMAACDMLYAQPSLRVFTDVDILIPSSDLAAWDQAIRSLGGRCTDDQAFGRRRFSARHYFEHAYRMPTDDPRLSVELDLHLYFGPRQRYPMDYALTAPDCQASARGPYLTLNPYQWICALAIHQGRALFVWSYQDYLDLFQILRQSEIREHELVATAGRFGALKASSILLRNLRLALSENSAVHVPDLDDRLPAGHEKFGEQMRLPVASRPMGDPSFLRNALWVARLSDSRARLVRYAVAYLAKRGADLVVRG